MTKPKKKTVGPKNADGSASVNTTDSNNALWPTTEQIAMLAATLASRTIPRDFMPSVLTKQALELWAWSQETIRLARFEDRFGQQEKKRRLAETDLTRFFKPSDKYPVTRDEMLKKVLPRLQGRKKKLAEISKAFWCDRLIQENLANKIYKRPTQKEIGFAYENWGPFKNHAGVSTEALCFKMWHDGYVISKRIATGKRTAARMRTRNNRKSKKETSSAVEEHSINFQK